MAKPWHLMGQTLDGALWQETWFYKGAPPPVFKRPMLKGMTKTEFVQLTFANSLEAMAAYRVYDEVRRNAATRTVLYRERE